MGALRLDPAEHLQFQRNGVAVGRGGRPGVDLPQRKVALAECLGRAAATHLQASEGFREIGEVAGAVAGCIGIGDVPGDHGLPRGGMTGLRAGEREDLEPVEHMGFSQFGYTDA